MNNSVDSMLLLRGCARRLVATAQQCGVSSVLHHVNAALREVSAAQRALEKSRAANDARQAAFTALTPASVDAFIKGEIKNGRQ